MGTKVVLNAPSLSLPQTLTPLHVAVSVGDRYATGEFVSAGYKPLDATRFTGVSPLAHAVFCGQMPSLPEP